MTPRTIHRRSLVCRAVSACGAGVALLVPAVAIADKPPPPIVVVLFPETDRPSADLKSHIKELKDDLRANPRLEVLSYSPDAPSFLLAAQQANVDVEQIGGEADRSALARALGAQLWVTVGQTRKSRDGHVDVTVRAARARASEGGGIAQYDDTVVQAAQLVTEQAMVLSAAQNAPPAPAAPPTIQATAPPPVPSPTTAPEQSETRAGAAPAPASAAPLAAPPAPAPATVAKPSPPLLAPPSAAPKHTVAVAPPAPLAVSAPVASSRAAAHTVVVAPEIPAPAPSVPMKAPDLNLAAPERKALPPTPVDQETQNWLNLGDDALAKSDTGRAVADYRRAVDESPRNAIPRIKLAQAYVASGQSESALDELRRASAIEPESTALRDYIDLVTRRGDLPGAGALLVSTPAPSNSASPAPNPASLLSLGDSYWNSSRLDLAETTYLQAASASGQPAPYARLARLYAATERYDDCLAALAKSGDLGYPAALRILVQRAGNLLGDLDDSLASFHSGKLARTDLYESLKKTDSRISAYTAFIGKLQPPPAFKVSYLHRRLAANLLAQVTPELENYAVTGDESFLTQAKRLEHNAETELSTANVADKLQTEVLSGG